MTEPWVQRFYDRKSEVTGPSGVLPHHVERAEAIARFAGRRAGRVLELGCGAGGSAVATAELGYDVTAVELSPVRACLARALAADRAAELRIVEGDYHRTDLGRDHDVAVMWNGFGMADDAGQRALLRRAAGTWLARDGRVVLDVFNPAGWLREAGHDAVDEETGVREQVGFDAVGGRFLDTWWFDGPDVPPLTQSVRCYGPADLVLLLEGTGLRLLDAECEGRPLDLTTASPLLAEAWCYRVLLGRVA